MGKNWEKLSYFLPLTDEIEAFSVISEALNFKIFWGIPSTMLVPSELISPNPKNIAQSLIYRL